MRFYKTSIQLLSTSFYVKNARVAAIFTFGVNILSIHPLGMHQLQHFSIQFQVLTENCLDLQRFKTRLAGNYLQFQELGLELTKNCV